MVREQERKESRRSPRTVARRVRATVDEVRDGGREIRREREIYRGIEGG